MLDKYEKNESCGIAVKKTMKSMYVNDPELFGINPIEKKIFYLPLIANQGNKCRFSKFSVVQNRAFNGESGKDPMDIKEMIFENSDLIYGGSILKDGKKKKRFSKKILSFNECLKTIKHWCFCKCGHCMIIDSIHNE